MEKRIIKINSKKEVVELLADKNGNMTETKYTIDDFFATWLKNICESHCVKDFSFTSDDCINIGFLSYGYFHAYEEDIALILDKSALDCEGFMAKMHYLEEVFENDKEKWQRHYADNLERKKEEADAANTCINMLKKMNNGEDVDFSGIENLGLILSFFYSHKDTILKNYSYILTSKQNKWDNRIALASIVSYISFICSFFATLFISLFSTFIKIPSLVEMIDVVILITSLFSSLYFSTTKDYGKEKAEEVFPKAAKIFEEQIVKSKEMSKCEEFEVLLEKDRYYMSSMGLDFNREESSLSNLTSSIGREDEFDEETRLQEIKDLLLIELQIYSKDTTIGAKDGTFYLIGDIYDVLDYVGVDEEKLNDEVINSLLAACKDMLDTPFYGCELEVTRLLNALLSYIEEMRKYSSKEEFVQSLDYGFLLDGIKTEIEAAKNKRDGALRLNDLREAREVLAKEGASKVEQKQTVIAHGVAMQMAPIEKKGTN